MFTEITARRARTNCDPFLNLIQHNRLTILDSTMCYAARDDHENMNLATRVEFIVARKRKTEAALDIYSIIHDHSSRMNRVALDQHEGFRSAV